MASPFMLAPCPVGSLNHKDRFAGIPARLNLFAKCSNSVKQHLASPTIHIVPANDVSHEDHALALLVSRHEKRLLDCTANRVRIIRVYKEGLGELARCSSECLAS